MGHLQEHLGPARWCDSKSVRHAGMREERFDYLWAGAIAIGVNDLIVRFDDGESVDGSDEEGEGEGGGSELAEVEAVFSDFHELVEGIFGYCTALSAACTRCGQRRVALHCRLRSGAAPQR